MGAPRTCMGAPRAFMGAWCVCCRLGGATAPVECAASRIVANGGVCGSSMLIASVPRATRSGVRRA
eukprot:5311171-Pleurochrysis_carterae.AAC.1